MTLDIKELLSLSSTERKNKIQTLRNEDLIKLAVAIQENFSSESIRLNDMTKGRLERLPNAGLKDIILSDLEHLDIKTKVPVLLQLLGFESANSTLPTLEESIKARYEVDHRGISKPKAKSIQKDKTEEIISLIQKLNEHDVSLETQDFIGLSLLHKLVSLDGMNVFDYDRIRVAKALIEAAPNILNLKWNDKDNPLEWAVRHNDPQLLEVLIPHYKDDKKKYVIDDVEFKESLLHYAENMGYTELADILKKNGFEYTKLEDAISKKKPYPYDESLTPLEDAKRKENNTKLGWYEFTPQKPNGAKPFLLNIHPTTIITSDYRELPGHNGLIAFIREHFNPSFFFTSVEKSPHLKGKDSWFPRMVNNCFYVSDTIKDELQYSSVTKSFFTVNGEHKLSSEIISIIEQLIKSKNFDSICVDPSFIEIYKNLLNFNTPYLNERLLNNKFLSSTIQNANLKVAEEFFKRKPGLTHDEAKELLKLIDKKRHNALEIRQLIRDERKRSQLVEQAKGESESEAKKAAKDIVSKYYEAKNGLQIENIPPEVKRLFADIGISTKEGFDSNIKENAKHRLRYVRDVDMGQGFISDVALTAAWLPKNLRIFTLKAKAFFTFKPTLQIAIKEELIEKLMTTIIRNNQQKITEKADTKFKDYKTKQLQRLHQ